MNKAVYLTGQEARDFLLSLAKKILYHTPGLEKDTADLPGILLQIPELQPADSARIIQHLPPWVKSCCILRGIQHDFWLALEADPLKISKDADTQLLLNFSSVSASELNSWRVHSWCLKAAEDADQENILIGQERISGTSTIVTLPAAGDAVAKIEADFS